MLLQEAQGPQLRCCSASWLSLGPCRLETLNFLPLSYLTCHFKSRYVSDFFLF